MRRLLPLLPVVCVLAACGSDGGNASEDVAQAASKTNAAQSYAISTSTRMKLGEKSVTFAGGGSFNVQKRRGKLSVDLRNLTELTGQNLGTIVMILNGSDLYLRMPFLKSLVPQLKPWLKLNLRRASPQGLDFSAFLQLGQGGDPTQLIQYLRGATEVKRKGKEDVRGVETTHYEMTVDLEQVAKTAPPAQRARLRAATQRLIQITGQRKIPVELWVDEGGLVRRLEQKQTFPIQGRKSEMTTRMELYDFGIPVDAAAPASSQVSDVSQLVPQGSGG